MQKTSHFNRRHQIIVMCDHYIEKKADASMLYYGLKVIYCHKITDIFGRVGRGKA